MTHARGSESPFPVSTLRSLVLPKEELAKILPNVERFLNRIHTAAAAKVASAKMKDLWFGREALRGPLTYSSRITTTV